MWSASQGIVFCLLFSLSNQLFFTHSVPFNARLRAGSAGGGVPKSVTHKEAPCISSPRCFLLSEIEKEEKEKLWYYSQLQGLSKRLDELPHVDTVSSRDAAKEGAGVWRR